MPTTKTATQHDAEAELLALRVKRDQLVADLDDARNLVQRFAEREVAQLDGGLGNGPRSVVALLAQASGEIGAIGKDKTMGTDGYKYRSIEAIAERAQPKFAELGIVLVPHRCTDLAYEDVENRNKTQGRHYLARWLWRAYGPTGDFIELETPGECAEWGGDKGAAKAMTASRKAALVAALCLAENSADPDTYASQEYTRATAAQEAAVETYVTQEMWMEWRDVREALRGTMEGEEWKNWADDNGFDLAKPGTLTVRQGDAVQAKARELLAGRNARATPEPGPPSVPEPTPEESPAQAIERLRQQVKAIEDRGAPTPEEPLEPQDGAGGAQPASDGQEGATEDEGGPKGIWQCNRCGVDVDGALGTRCPVCGKGELADLRDPEEPF